jgi:hypothetical protein
MNYGMMNGTEFVGGWCGTAIGGLTMLLSFALIVGLIVLVIKALAR